MTDENTIHTPAPEVLPFRAVSTGACCVECKQDKSFSIQYSIPSDEDLINRKPTVPANYHCNECGHDWTGEVSLCYEIPDRLTEIEGRLDATSPTHPALYFYGQGVDDVRWLIKRVRELEAEEEEVDVDQLGKE